MFLVQLIFMIAFALLIAATIGKYYWSSQLQEKLEVEKINKLRLELALKEKQAIHFSASEQLWKSQQKNVFLAEVQILEKLCDVIKFLVSDDENTISES